MIFAIASWIYWAIIMLATCIMAVILLVMAVAVVVGVPAGMYYHFVEKPKTDAMWARLDKAIAERDPNADYSAEGMIARIKAAGEGTVQERAEELGLKVRWE